jgi:hypothetical protein
MQPETYLSGEKIEPMPVPDFKHDFKDYKKFDIGAIGEFDVSMLIEQYAGKPLSKRLYPEWRGGYYYAVMPKDSGSGAPLGMLYVSRWSSAEKASEFADIYARSLPERYKKVEVAGDPPQDHTASQESDRKSNQEANQENDAQSPEFKIDLLTGRHVWTTDEGTVVIEEQGDMVFISESLDASTTATLEKEVLPK